MSDLRTPDQILADVGIKVETLKKDKELLYSCIRRAMDDFAEQYHEWKISKANGADKCTESVLHKHIVIDTVCEHHCQTEKKITARICDDCGAVVQY